MAKNVKLSGHQEMIRRILSGRSPHKTVAVEQPKRNPMPDEEQGPYGPVFNPVDRFIHLPAATRSWLESLNEDEISEIKDALKFYHATRTVGKFWKWFIISMIGIFVAAVQFGEAVIKAFNWFLGRGPQ